MTSPLITCQAVAKSFGSRLLFKEISLTLFPGNKVGLIGPNGSGKSTLLKILLGLEAPDEGQVVRKRDLSIGYVPQSSLYPSLPVKDVVLASNKHGSAHHSHEWETRVNIILDKCGFTDPLQLADRLSGGWKKRLDIACALAGAPEVILFDEPTNHLDLEGIKWLEKLLQQEKLTFVIISHDRTFLEKVTNRTMEINKTFPKGIFIAETPYLQFVEKRREFLEGQVAYQQSLSSKVRSEVEWLRQTPQARTTKSQARVDQAGRLIDELADVKKRNTIAETKISFSWTERQTQKLLAAKNLTKSINNRKLINGLDLTLSPGMRLGIVGANGTGKTTLLKLLAGEIAPDMGTIKYADGLKIVYFDQQRAKLPTDISLRRAFAPDGERVNFQGQSIHVNSWANRFLFPKDQLDLPVSQLSGGEKARVLIARLMLQTADVLLLDEPTNDLDIPTLETLESSLQEFTGAVVLITHDRRMLENVCQGVIGLGEELGTTQIYSDLEQWERAKTPAKDKLSAKEKTASPPLPQSPKKKTGLSYLERKELDQMEQRIAEAEKAIETLHCRVDELSASSDRDGFNKACEELGTAQHNLETLFSRWQELESKNQ